MDLCLLLRSVQYCPKKKFNADFWINPHLSLSIIFLMSHDFLLFELRRTNPNATMAIRNVLPKSFRGLLEARDRGETNSQPSDAHT
jgi:hypothetical protein